MLEFASSYTLRYLKKLLYLPDYQDVSCVGPILIRYDWKEKENNYIIFYEVS